MHLPVCLEESVYRFFRKEIRRAMWAVQDLDVPLLWVRRDHVAFKGMGIGDGSGSRAAG